MVIMDLRCYNITHGTYWTVDEKQLMVFPRAHKDELVSLA